MQLRDARFLVVDDHQPMREILKSLLFGLGARHVDEARDAAVAFDMLRISRYDVLLTDYDMAGETGVQLTSKVRHAAQNPNRRMAVIMVTGRAEGPVILSARDVGVDEYLIKPLTAASLCAKLDAVFGRRRPFIETETYIGPCRRRRTVDFDGPERRRDTASPAARTA
ncbi:MAG: response regulator [Alphaproteobacteria bacterium]|nr:response regulator [Alphaproteobacteria bacterium]